jgi:iron complex outermembrane recepter protein
MKRKQPIHAALWALPMTATLAFSQNAAPAEGTQLDALTVTAQAEAAKKSYAPPEVTTGALKTPTPLLETPQAVTVVSEELIQDQDAVKLEEILRNVAGISAGGYYGSYDQFRIRGFDASYKTYWDGLRGDNGTAPELFGMERVEVIKGPASALYGNGPLGGLVNLVSKRPGHDPSLEIGTRAGSFNTYEGTIDANSALYTPGSAGADGESGVFGRIVGLYRQSDTFINHSEVERLYIAPSVLFQFSEDTKLTLLGSYTNDDDITGMPVPAAGSILPNPNGKIPRDFFVGIPGQGNHIEFSRLRLGYEFSHRINDTVSLRQNFNYSRIDQDWDRILYPPFTGPFTNLLSLTPYSLDDTSERVSVDNAVDFTFDTRGIDHTATVGLDYYYERGRARSAFDFANPVIIDVYNPDYNQTVNRAPLGPKFQSGSETFGFYAQDHMKLSETVALTLGARFDNYQDRVSRDSETALSPKIGVSYEFIKDVAAYANYSTSFEPQSATGANGPTAVDPLSGENIEAGVKYSALDGRWTGMASVFQLTRQDAAIQTSPVTYTLAGEQRTRGFELENSLELVPGLQLTSAYTYLDAEVTEDGTLANGTPLIGVPENTLSAWAKYTIQEGALQGVGFGFGGRYLSNQSGDVANSFDLPSYTVLDAALFYEKENFSAQLNFKNITNKYYAVGSYSDTYVLPGEPFSVMASASWKF